VSRNNSAEFGTCSSLNLSKDIDTALKEFNSDGVYDLGVTGRPLRG
jgi:hypothetical protein